MSNNRFDIDAQPYDAMTLKLRYISSACYDADWHSTMHSHEFTELFFVISGQGQFKVEELTFLVNTDDIIIINPLVEHTELPLYKGTFEYVVLGIEGGGFLLADSLDARYSAFHCDKGRDELIYYMQEMLTELEGKEQYSSATAQLLLEIFSIKLLRYQAVSVAVSPAPKTSVSCNAVKRYIDNHYKEEINLDILSDIVHLSKHYLVHVFTKENGISPINYLTERRIKEGRHLLQNTSLNISQISEILGFSSPSYFTQCFQRTTGMSPREYRKTQSFFHPVS